MDPKTLQKGEFYDGIIDIYDQNADIQMKEVARLNVRAVIHQTSLGLKRTDTLYARRKKEAQALGLLWGAYHVVTAEPVDEQLDRFFSIEDGTDPSVLMALDWEETSRGIMSVDQLIAFAEQFAARRSGAYPVFYGGHLIPENKRLQAGEAVLSNCPLWYIWLPQEAMRLPTKTWAEPTLHQFDTQKRRHGAPYPVDVLEGADFNRFRGTEQGLAAAWPFSRP